MTMGPIDARPFLWVEDLPGVPSALLYVSPLIGDPAVEVLPAALSVLGLPYTRVEGPSFVLQDAGRGWRCTLTRARWLSVTRRGTTLVEVERMDAPPGWVEAALAEGQLLVMAGPPIPAVAGERTSAEQVLGWAASRPSCSGLVPVVEGVRG
ncbi:hypothetical protein F5972_08300 [Microbispora cellulosiformans]|uniref:Uncharacterized protein n=1 Tax=Microbispora cellulosiformans TaxID=2614688 RepID=A0A5J5K7H0_9ACTN|nr:hypothetical protein [Microbispora cellulosiformans]KAA9379644.1 hypothetical protein F5972_08300 [Microbispora cellulosiformans]